MWFLLLFYINQGAFGCFFFFFDHLLHKLIKVRVDVARIRTRSTSVKENAPQKVNREFAQVVNYLLFFHSFSSDKPKFESESFYVREAARGLKRSEKPWTQEASPSISPSGR